MVFLWCQLDDALSVALEERAGATRRKVDQSFHERLGRLKVNTDRGHEADPERAAEISDLVTRLNHARRRRNLIVHSLRGISADPAKGEPHLTCDKNESSVRITQTALTALLQDMDRCRRQLGNLSARSTSRSRMSGADPLNDDQAR